VRVKQLVNKEDEDKNPNLWSLGGDQFHKVQPALAEQNFRQ
jgi:hypothetical protein